MTKTDAFAWLTHWCAPALMWQYSRGRCSYLCHCFYCIINCIFWHFLERKDIWNQSDWLNKKRVTHAALGAQVSVGLVSSVEWKGQSLRLLQGVCLCCSCGWSQGRSRSAPGFSEKPDCLLHRYTPPALYRPHPLLHAHNYPPIKRERCNQEANHLNVSAGWDVCVIEGKGAIRWVYMKQGLSLIL